MKLQRTRFPRVSNFLAILIICAGSVIPLSCKKSSIKDISFKDDLIGAANMVNGTVLYGSLTSESNNNQIGLSYNNGQKYIIIDKLPGRNNLSINIPSAGLILSECGVIIKDESKNSFLLLANNDPRSITQFKTLASHLNGSIQSSLIYGLTVVNADRQ
jgi:hypothetical protein